MENFTAIQKQQIMLLSDLLKEPLTKNEIIELKNSNLDVEKKIDKEQLKESTLCVELQNKIIELLRQGMRLGLELNKLTGKGIKVKFISDLKGTILKFNGNLKFLFMIGNETLLTCSDSIVIDNFTEFKKKIAECKIIFMTDRNFDALLSSKEIKDGIENGRLILVSNFYRKKSDLKGYYTNNAMSKKGKVFISGSRSQNIIPDVVQNSLKSIIDQNIQVLIGDSDKGVDHEILDYLRGSYHNVEVFTIKKRPRVQIEKEWKKRIVPVEMTLNAQEKQTVKDRVMGDEADWGMAIFNPISKNRFGAIQVSTGTLRNTIQMLLNNKAVKFFYIYENKMIFKNLKTIKDLEQVISSYKIEKLTKVASEEILSCKSISTNADPTNEKFDKIYKKYQELLTKEYKLKQGKHKTIACTKMLDQIKLF